MNMKKEYIIGGSEWKIRVLDDLKDIKNYLLNTNKDMVAYKVDNIINELKTYFERDERKN
jgi:hypothetical protein